MSPILRCSLFAFLTLASFSGLAQPAAFDHSITPQIQYNTGLPVTGRYETLNLQSRLVAQTRYRYSDAIAALQRTDSTLYRYSGARGGGPAVSLRFDESVSTGSSGMLSQRSVQSYNPDGSVAEYGTQRQDSVSETWTDQYRYVIVSRNGRRMGDSSWSWSIAQSRWIPATYSVYARNASGQPERITRFDWNKELEKFDSSAQTVFAYDPSGNPASQLSRFGKGRLQPASRATYSYNSRNAATRIEIENWDSSGGTWLRTVAYAFDVNAGNQRSTQTNLFWNGKAYNWEPALRYRYSYDAAGNAVAVESEAVQAGTDTWRSIDRCVYTYNGPGQVTLMQRQVFGAGSSSTATTTERRRYYYEPIAAGMSAAAGPAPLKVWPLPARKSLNIDVQALRGAGYTAVVSDLGGRTASSWQRAITTASTERFDTEGLPAGTYILRVQSLEGAQFQARFSIVK